MVAESTRCDNCIKEDVCSRKIEYAAVVGMIERTNTSAAESMTYWPAKDNDNIKIIVGCSKFSPLIQNVR